MDFLAVAGANFFLKRCRKMRWLLLGAAVSAVLGLCCILLCRNYLLYCLLTHFLINTLMTVICFGRCDRRQFFENWLAVYLVVLLLGGAFEWLQESGILSKSRGVAIAAAVTVTCGLLRYLGRRRAFGSHVRRAWLGKDARRMALSAYWDSGNQLRDPYTGQPICILSYSLAEKFVDQTKDRIRFVPYRALGAEDGLLAVMDVDEMILQDGRQMRRYEHMAVGIAQKGLLEDKEYDLILHASLG